MAGVVSNEFMRETGGQLVIEIDGDPYGLRCDTGQVIPLSPPGEPLHLLKQQRVFKHVGMVQP